ncbi:MAG: NAD-dependent epimerase/dehydratase family protein [Acidobacteriota bacterium]
MSGCLVTGASGFLGSRLVRELAAAGDRVRAVSRTRIEGLTTAVGDLAMAPVDLKGVVEAAIYHLAGLAHVVPRTRAEAQRFSDVNLGGTRNLLTSLDRAADPPKTFVFVSSVSVYGLDSGELLDEDTPRLAIEPYGASKRAAEDLVRDWGKARGVRVAIARLPLVVGREAPGNFGAMVGALRRGWYYGVADGGAKRSMVLVDDAAKGLRLLSEAGGVYHLTDGRHPTFAELERSITFALGRRPPPRLSFPAARAAAKLGDLVERVTGRPVPFTHQTFSRMTSTLTFSDQRARERIAWAPRAVIDAIPEIVA